MFAIIEILDLNDHFVNLIEKTVVKILKVMKNKLLRKKISLMKEVQRLEWI